MNLTVKNQTVILKITGVLFIALFFTANNFKATAQLSVLHAFKRIDSVALISLQNDTLNYPFAGGLNSCQLMNIDINLDGIDDVLVFDRHGYRILPFIVLPGSAAELLFKPELAVLFPPLEQWVQSIDYNNDGKKDLFTYTTGGIKVYRNDSQNGLKFTRVTNPFLLSLQGSTLTNILVTYADYPAIADVDADGDMDVLTFWGLGSFVEWHRNTSIERFGNADSLTFEKSSSCWGHFAEGNEDNAIILDTCAGSDKQAYLAGDSQDDPKHTGSTLLLNDLNGDGLPDLAIADVDFSTLIQLQNGGTQAEARMISQTPLFPNALNPVNLNTFPAAMLADADNDGIRDLLVSPFDPSLIKGKNVKSIYFYHNSGTNTLPAYSLVSESFLQNQMLDLGSGAYPVFFDCNGDGLTDVLVGNYGYSDTCVFTPANGLQCTFISKLALLINEGTQQEPVFRLANSNVAQLDSLKMQSLIPSIADMDGDGDADLVCGNSKGKLLYCENIAEFGQQADFKLIDPAWHLIDAGDFSAPQLFDVNADGLTDLICGKRNGTLSYFKNTGSVETPEFTLISDHFGGVDVTDTQQSNDGYSVPCFYTNKQGKTILFVGSEFGDIIVYDELTMNPGQDFRLLGKLPGIKTGWRSAAAIGNLNGDSLTDMFVGNYSGGLDLFFGKPDKIFGMPERAGKSEISVSILPNPASDKVSFNVEGIGGGVIVKSILIQGIEGKVIRQLTNEDFPLMIDVSGFENGIYLVSVHTTLGSATGKLVICR